MENKKKISALLIILIEVSVVYVLLKTYYAVAVLLKVTDTVLNKELSDKLLFSMESNFTLACILLIYLWILFSSLKLSMKMEMLESTVDELINRKSEYRNSKVYTEIVKEEMNREIDNANDCYTYYLVGGDNSKIAKRALKLKERLNELND